MKFFSRKNKAHPTSLEFDMHVRRADVANSLKQWDIAADYYGKALQIKPEVSAIHIQYGHSLKEQGLLKESEIAYRNALKADNANADGYLHLGHISKLQKDMRSAISAYRSAARLGSTSDVGADARRELSALGVRPPAIVTIEIPAFIADDPAYKDIVAALKQNRLMQARVALQSLPDSVPAEVKLIEAQVLHILGRFDEAIVLHEDRRIRSLGPKAFAAARALYSDHGVGDQGARLAIWALEEGLQSHSSFETLANPVAHLAKLGQLDAAFYACKALFQPEAPEAQSDVRTSASIKRGRGSSHFTPGLKRELRDDFLTKALRLDADGQYAQATLLRDEAAALKPLS